MKEIYVITDSYPFGYGEKTFLIPELEYLRKDNSITIISCGDLDENVDGAYFQNTGVRLLKYSKKIDSVFGAMLIAIKAVCSAALWYDVLEIIKKREKVFLRLKTSFWFVFKALVFEKWMIDHIKISSDVVLYTYWYFSNTLGIVFLKQKYGQIKIVTRAHGYDLHDLEAKGERQCCKKYMDRYLDAISFISQEGMDYYLRTNGIAQAHRHSIQYLGVPAANVKPNINDNRTQELVVVSCSSIDQYKRIHLIIDALALVNEYKLKWIHFGDGVLSDEVKAYAKTRLASKTNIIYEFKGFVDRKVIYDYYSLNEVNCYILVSYLEGLPVANMEALAHAFPVITTKSGGTPETIDENGFLLSENPEPDEIKRSIDLIKNARSDEYIRMRQKSYELWQQKFNADANFIKYASIFKEM